MKILIMIAVVATSLTSYAQRTGGRNEAPSPVKELMSRSVTRLNGMSSMLGRNYSFEAAGKISLKSARRFDTDLTRVNELLETKSAELRKVNNQNKKNEISAILEGIETSYSTRASLVELKTSVSGKAAKEQVQDLIDYIDNLFTILEAKILDSPEAVLSAEQIMRTITAINEASLVTASDVVALANQVKAILGRVSIKQASKCRAA